jgi:hypothetical protein
MPWQNQGQVLPQNHIFNIYPHNDKNVAMTLRNAQGSGIELYRIGQITCPIIISSQKA